MALTSRLSGAVWGHLVGDAVGVPWEGSRPADFLDLDEPLGLRGWRSHHQPPGTWSDDGAMMLALLDSLLEAGFDPADQARCYLRWADEGAYTPDGDGLFDIGGTTQQALALLRRGTPAAAAGGIDEHSNGNGSLMRTLPIALVGRRLDDAVLVEQAHRASSVTHAHPVSQVTCALYVLVARRLLAGARDRAACLRNAVAWLREHYRSRGDANAAKALERLLSWPERTGRGYVVDAFWSAWEAFERAHDYRGTTEIAVGYGHDTDSTACIAGGLAGLYWGLEAIPSEWLEGMRGKSIVEPILRRLVAAARRA